MRKRFITLFLAVLLMTISITIPAQESTDTVKIDIEIEMEHDEDGDAYHGGGYLTYSLTGQAAGDLRRAVLARYDGLITGTANGRIDPAELKMNEQTGYIADVETSITNTAFNTINTNSYDPVHEGQGEDITADAQGFYEVVNIASDNSTPITITLYFDATSTSYEPESEVPDSMFKPFKNALYSPFITGTTGLIESPNIHLDEYAFEYSFENNSPGNGISIDADSTLIIIVIVMCATVLGVVYLITRRPKS